MFFFTQLKLNMSEIKSKNWKFYINTLKNVSTAFQKLPHFLSEHVFIVKKLNTSLELLGRYCVNRERKPGGE